MSILSSQPGTAKELAALGAEWLPREPLARHTSLGVGGPADVVRIRDARRIGDLIAYIDDRGAKWRLLGGGTNLLVADEGIDDVAIHLVRDPQGLKFEGGRVEVATSSNLGTTVMECGKRNLGGMEGLVGVPGSVGGALHMNAGAYGTEIKDVVRAVTVYRGAAGRVEILWTDKVHFEYRGSSFAPDDILLSVTLELPEKPYAEILERVKQCNQKRRASQPINEKSAGCIFKNPPGVSTGKMIDELGLKGTRMGGAVVSERHANFLVNRYGATASDFVSLMDLIRERILKAYGVELEEEVIVWKN
ncbi:MAG: UDP-N-acetylmuramate dehydrogenase [Acidobacteria bacterium]|nr:UDP-N-acetylmuramate dehydrogenase [Acidobacteriota bacterium]